MTTSRILIAKIKSEGGLRKLVKAKKTYREGTVQKLAAASFEKPEKMIDERVGDEEVKCLRIWIFVSELKRKK